MKLEESREHVIPPPPPLGGHPRFLKANRPRSIYQYSNMAPRLSGQTSIFGVVFFVSKSLLGILRDERNLKYLQF